MEDVEIELSETICKLYANGDHPKKALRDAVEVEVGDRYKQYDLESFEATSRNESIGGLKRECG
ncbi:hypothetical protein HAX54_027473, partial [Datura stramonium]|nr:hypothetical protein [Datura stramonium]